MMVYGGVTGKNDRSTQQKRYETEVLLTEMVGLPRFAKQKWWFNPAEMVIYATELWNTIFPWTNGDFLYVVM